jgi:AcrR family transcriptional regulator
MTDGREISTHIIDAALATLASTGSRGLSVTEVGVRAGVSRGAVYRHFGGKDGLLAAIGVRMADTFKDSLAAHVRSNPDPDVRLEVVIEALVDVGHRHPEALQLLASEPGFGMDFLRAIFAEFVGLVDQLLAVAVAGHRSSRFAGVGSAELAELVVRIVMSAYLIPATTPAVGEVRSAVSAELFLLVGARAHEPAG